MKDEWAVAYVDVIFGYLSGDTNENHKTISIIGVPVQTGTGHLYNTHQKRHRLTNFIPQQSLTKTPSNLNSSSVVYS
jgi:hypothetical protein